MAIYDHTDYRDVIKELLTEMKARDQGFTHASYAESIGVQKPFVSRVLSENAHLSDDQLYLSFDFFKLSQSEIHYLQLLYSYSRSGLKSRKDVILREIHRLQEEQRQFRIHTRAEMQRPEANPEMGEYYLDPLNLVVHVHMGIAMYRKQPHLLAHALGVTRDQIQENLQTLERLKIIKIDGKGVVSLEKSAIHLDVRSIYCKPHQMIFRIRSQERIMKLSAEKRFMFNLTFSGDPKLKDQIQKHYLEFMKKVEGLIKKVESSEMVYQINFDLFPWTDG